MPRQFKSCHFFSKYWGMIINGVEEGVFSTEEIKNNVVSFNIKEIYIQHFQRLRLEEFIELINYFKCPLKFFLHDYYSICTHYCLLDDNGEYCGECQPSENKCVGRCQDANDNIKRYNRIRKFFEEYNNVLEVISPSYKASEIFSKSFPIMRNIVIVPHQIGIGVNSQFPGCDKFRIAYVGYQGEHKGYNIWRKLVSNLRNNKIEFYHLGKASEFLSNVKYVSVDYRKSNRDMVSLLKRNNINIAFLWSIWPETYSYTYYECYAANVFIITNKHSGNIADQVLKNRNGVVLDTYDDLVNLFNNSDELFSKMFEFYKKKMYGPLILDTYMPYIEGIALKDSQLATCKKEKSIISKFISVLYSKYENWRKKVNNN